MNEPEVQNTVVLDPLGYVFIRFVGDQDYRSVEDVAGECKKLIDKLRFDNKPVFGLIDYSEERGFNTGAHKAAMEVLGNLDYDKAAFFGSNPKLAEIIDLIIKAHGDSDKIRMFADRQEAVNWLLEGAPNGR